MDPLKDGIIQATAQAPQPTADAANSTLVLASKRTRRPDILRGFRQYHDGWNISNQHYWAVSAAF